MHDNRKRFGHHLSSCKPLWQKYILVQTAIIAHVQPSPICESMEINQYSLPRAPSGGGMLQREMHRCMNDWPRKSKRIKVGHSCTDGAFQHAASRAGTLELVSEMVSTSPCPRTNIKGESCSVQKGSDIRWKKHSEKWKLRSRKFLLKY